MAANSNEKIAGIETSQLAELVRTIMAEARKPTELEQEELEARKAEREAKQAQVLQDQAIRKDTAAQKLEEIAMKKTTQAVCTHENRRGDTHIVFIQSDPLGGYLLCQKCQAVIRPAEQRRHYPQNYGGMIIFDSTLFNRLIQKTSVGGIID